MKIINNLIITDLFLDKPKQPYALKCLDWYEKATQ